MGWRGGEVEGWGFGWGRRTSVDGGPTARFDQVTLRQFFHYPGEGARAVFQLEERQIRRQVNDKLVVM